MTITDTEWAQSIEWVRVIVGSVIYKDGKYLLIQERQKRAYGLWNLPAGHVDKGETLEQATRRETEEETGYDIEIISEIGIYHHNAQSSVKHAYEAKIIGGIQLESNDEIMQVKWLLYEEIEAMNCNGHIRAEWVWRAIEDHHATLIVS